MQCRVCPALDPTPIGPWGVVAGVGVTTIAVGVYYIVPAGVLPVIVNRLSIGSTTGGRSSSPRTPGSSPNPAFQR